MGGARGFQTQAGGLVLSSRVSLSGNTQHSLGLCLRAPSSVKFPGRPLSGAVRRGPHHHEKSAKAPLLQGLLTGTVPVRLGGPSSRLPWAGSIGQPRCLRVCPAPCELGIGPQGCPREGRGQVWGARRLSLPKGALHSLTPPSPSLRGGHWTFLPLQRPRAGPRMLG